MGNVFTNAKAVEMTVEEYNAAPQLRRSAAWTRFDKGPEIYEATHVTGTIPSEETQALRMGTWIHYGVLEPDVWEDLARPVKLPTKRSKSWSEHEEECKAAGKIALLQSEHDQVAAVTNAFRRCKRAQHWLETADAIEKTIVAEANVAGQVIGVKARLDIRRRGAVIDLKSTAEPTPESFGKSITSYGYWYQAAWYLMAEAAASDMDVEELTFVALAVEKTEPHRVAIYELGPEWWMPGVDAVRWTLEQLAREQEAGTWVSEWNGRPTMLVPPPWFESFVSDRTGGA